jgi:uncharacterized protein (DUF427 family)
MPKAVWKGAVIAESDDTTLLEGDHYFPPETVDRKYLRESAEGSARTWMGEIRYFHIVIGKNIYKNGAFYYPNPSKAALAIKGHIAFSKGVEIEK